MKRSQVLLAWFCLLLWGGTHVMQWEHVVVHHLLHLGHSSCSHDHGGEGSEKRVATGHEWPVVQSNEDCAVCDWTAVPAWLSGGQPALPVCASWPTVQVMGGVHVGWTDPQAGLGTGWRGPPVENRL